jgi:hypothetical protein
MVIQITRNNLRTLMDVAVIDLIRTYMVQQALTMTTHAMMMAI